MIKHMGLKGKILAITAIPVFSVIILGGFILNEQWRVLSGENRFIKLAHYAKQAASTVHVLQIERGTSAGFISSKGQTHAGQIAARRAATDAELKKLEEIIKSTGADSVGGRFEERLQAARSGINRLGEIRGRVSSLGIAAPEAGRFYTGIVLNLIKTIAAGAQLTTDADLSTGMLGYERLLFAKEEAGLERALLNAVLTRKSISADQFLRFSNLVALQENHLAEFEETISGKLKEDYDVWKSEVFNVEVGRIRGIVFGKIEKDRLLGQLQKEIGYGGLIHQFKNLVIRGDQKFADRTIKRFDAGNRILQSYFGLSNLSDEESFQLNAILGVISAYREGVDTVTEMVAQRRSVKQIDGLVKINDGPALKAVDFLTRGNFGIQPQTWFQHATQRIDGMNTLGVSMIDGIAAKAGAIYNGALTTALMFAVFVLIVLAITGGGGLSDRAQPAGRGQRGDRQAGLRLGGDPGFRQAAGQFQHLSVRGRLAAGGQP